MSPRGSANAAASPSSRPSTTPYARRSTSQPKSSRQQFSACGACRMRRVRCDLKDLPIGFVGPHPACSNCKERGIKCVDEFADVKAVKLLRRGRRLQQVEAIYGKTADQDPNSSSTSLSRTITIPTLHPDFFASSFWRWFSIQRPILDANEFPARFAAHLKGTQSLTGEGALLAMLLVTWATSFGLNERGYPESQDGSTDSIDGSPSEGSPMHPVYGRYPPPGNKRRQWKSKTESYIREILELVDFHGLLRRPTLDGVRVLLLLLPLLEDAQPLERLVIYEATLSQVQALCIVSAVSPPSYEDSAARARLFWYAYTQEGLLTGIRGGRFVLNSEDLDTFQRTLPPADHSSPSSPPLDAAANMSAYHHQESSSFSAQDEASRKAYHRLMHAAAAPLDLSNICRRIHTVLTGIKATRRAEDHGLIDANGMRDIWRGLDRCWQELEAMKRQVSSTDRDNVMRRLEINQYVSGWQIFIFECHNVIRESLKHFANSTSTSQTMYDPSSSSRPSSHSSSSSPYLSPDHLHVAANRRCIALLPRIINIIRTHTPRENGDIPCIFRWDASLVRDGCFFAAYLVANLESEFVDAEEDEKSETRDLTVDEGVSICLNALATMRWGFSKSEEREETIKMIWENRKLRRQGQAHHLPLYDSEYPQPIVLPGPDMSLNLSPSPHMGVSSSSSEDRPMLPPLNLFISQRRVESAPSTACSTDDRGSNAWPSYTPPGTATSIATSTGTGFSRRGSPVFANLGGFKASEDVFYNGPADVDQFNYSVPVAGPMIRENPAMVSNAAAYGHRHSPMESQALVASSATNYMVTTPFNITPSSILTQADFHSCPQFGENCNGAYH